MHVYSVWCFFCLILCNFFSFYLSFCKIICKFVGKFIRDNKTNTKYTKNSEFPF